MPKFEIGDKVKIVAVDIRWYAYAGKMQENLGKIGEIVDYRCFPDDEDPYFVSIKGKNTFYYPESWLELVEKKKPELYNGKSHLHYGRSG